MLGLTTALRAGNADDGTRRATGGDRARTGWLPCNSFAAGDSAAAATAEFRHAGAMPAE